jgi:hypothetical protein
MMQAKTWEVPGDLLAKSVEHMRPYGTRGHEGLALWFGDEADGIVAITHLVLPYGPGLTTHPLRLSLSMRAMSRLTRLAGELDSYWAGQIHSHPGTMVGLSEVDEEMGVRVQDYLSLVCPYYAQRETRDFAECGVHMFDGGAYRRLGTIEVSKRIALCERRVRVVPVEVLA